MSIQAYQRAATRAEAPREIEYRLFGEVTAGLARAKEKGRADLYGLALAVDENRRLWAALGADCAHPENQLPDALRAQIISLMIFVEKHSTFVIREGEDIDTLIDINKAMMEGLAGR